MIFPQVQESFVHSETVLCKLNKALVHKSCKTSSDAIFYILFTFNCIDISFSYGLNREVLKWPRMLQKSHYINLNQRMFLYTWHPNPAGKMKINMLDWSYLPEIIVLSNYNTFIFTFSPNPEFSTFIMCFCYVIILVLISSP